MGSQYGNDIPAASSEVCNSVSAARTRYSPSHGVGRFHLSAGPDHKRHAIVAVGYWWILSVYEYAASKRASAVGDVCMGGHNARIGHVTA
jgi:hypothetical protein